MHLLNCLHPVRVTDRFGEERVVPCGKCDYCRFVHNSQWSDRIRLEIQSHKFSVFCTLTYADCFLPRMFYNESLNSLCVESSNSSFDFLAVDDDSGLCVDLPEYFTLSDKSVISRISCKYGFVPYLRRADFQKFMKRLRINIDRKVKSNEKIKVGYAACGEYGPTTFRPHFHFLLWFDSESLAKDIHKLIHTSWPYGSSKSRFSDVSGKESGYVSQYVNCVSRFPKVYELKEFRPFFLVSKSNLVGSSSISHEECKRVVLGGLTSFRYFDRRLGRSAELSLWPSLENRLFPRFVGFGMCSDWQRIRLFRFAFRKDESFVQFQTRVYDMLNSNVFELSNRYEPLRKDFVYEYLSCIVKYRSHSVGAFPDRRFLDSGLYSLWRFSHLVMSNCLEFGIFDEERYVRLIDEHYVRRDYENLVNQLRMQQDKSFRPEWFQFVDIYNSSYKDVLKCGEMTKVIDHIKYNIDHSHKNRVKRDYLYLHPEYSVFHQPSDFLEGLQ